MKVRFIYGLALFILGNLSWANGAYLGTKPATISEIAALSAALSAKSTYQHIYVSEAGFQATYDWNPSAAQYCPTASYIPPDNSYICPSDVVIPTTGRWVRGIPGSYPVYTVEQFSGAADGVTDNYTAIQRALAAIAAAGGGKLVFSSTVGSYALASASVAAAALNVPNNTTIECAPKGVKLLLTGSTPAQNWFQADNPTNTYVGVNCDATSNGLAPGTGTVGFVYYRETVGATGPVTNFGSPGLILHNFQADAWVEMANLGSYPMYNWNMDGYSAYSQNGNAIAPGTQGSSSAALLVNAQINNLGGTILQGSWRGGYVDATYIKACGNFYNSSYIRVDQVYCYQPGLNIGLSGLHYGGFIFYRSGTIHDSEPTDNFVTNSVIINPLNYAISCQDVLNCVVSNTSISGLQNIAPNVAFHQGALQWYAGATGASLNNVLQDNYGAAIWWDAPDGKTLTVSGTKITSSAASSRGIYIDGCQSPSTCSQNGTGVVTLANNNFTLTGTSTVAIEAQSNSGGTASPGVINIVGGTYAGTADAYYVHDVGGPIYAGGATNISGNAFFGGPSANGTFYTSGATPLNISGALFDGTGLTNSIFMVSLNGQTNVNINNATFQNVPNSTSYIIDTRDAQGALSGLSFFKNANTTAIAVPSGGGHLALGLAAPTFTGTMAQFVQNLNPVEEGSTPKYITRGWTQTTAPSGTGWLPNREPDGN